MQPPPPVVEPRDHELLGGPPAPGEEAGDILLSCADDVAAEQTDVPVVRLRSTPGMQGPGDDSVYRYDRAGLMIALAAGGAARTGGRG